MQQMQPHLDTQNDVYTQLPITSKSIVTPIKYDDYKCSVLSSKYCV